MRRKGYVLCFALILVFAASSILALSVMRLTSFSDVASVYLTHSRVRSELISTINFAWKWLAANLEAGDFPRAEASAFSDAESLRVFVRSTENSGSVEIFDMGYVPSDASPSEDELPLFPPHCRDGYLIRATMAGKGQAALIMENVYLMTSGDAPGGERFYKLERKSVYSREIFR